MKNLIIIGARGFGREVYNMAIQCKEYGTEWNIKGFLDDKGDSLDDFNNYPPILGSVEDYIIETDDVFCCALGDVVYKKKYAKMIIDKGGVFVNLIHPNINLNGNVKLGVGLIICAFSFISNEVAIGDFVTIQSHVAIGHDASVGDWSVINAFSFLGGFCKVGHEVTIYPGAKIMPRKTVNDGASVGIGSVVMRNVKSNSTVFGIPAKEI